MPSQWRLAVLMLLIVGCSIALALFFVRAAVSNDLRAADRAIIFDDLVEYAAIYNHSGLPAVQEVFPAGQHSGVNALRITTKAGALVCEMMPEAFRRFPWPTEAPPQLARKGDTSWKEISVASPRTQLIIGAIRLRDGNILWFGRTDAAAERYLTNIRYHLWLAGITAALISLLPVLWYSHDVIRPIQSFITSARRLHLTGGEARLIAPRAIPELQTLASVVNAALDHNLSLTRELQSTNDQLAHELRTPLARIRGNLESLHDLSESEDAQEAAARGLEEIDRATQLVQTILTVRAGDHGALRLYRQVTAIYDLLQKLVDLFTPAAEDRRLTLSLEPDLEMTLNIDRELMTQAIANLLDNALAYTPAGGHITLRWRGDGTDAIIFVEDTGPGLRVEELEIIWDRYSRGSAAKARSPGIGLGLSLVRAIAMAHGGAAGALNRDGGGACFWVRLPQG